MLQPKCRRCDGSFEPTERGQTRCHRCADEVARIVESDSRRRTRFPRAVDLTGRLA